MKFLLTILAFITLVSCAVAPSYKPEIGEEYSSLMIADIANETAAQTLPRPDWNVLTVKVIDASTGNVVETKTFQKTTGSASDAKLSVKYGDYRFELQYVDANQKPIYASCEADKKFVHRIAIPLYTPTINLCLASTGTTTGNTADVVLKPVLTTNTGTPGTQPSASETDPVKAAEAAVAKIEELVKLHKLDGMANLLADAKGHLNNHKSGNPEARALACVKFGEVAFEGADLPQAIKQQVIGELSKQLNQIFGSGKFCDSGSSAPKDSVSWSF